MAQDSGQRQLTSSKLNPCDLRFACRRLVQAGYHFFARFVYPPVSSFPSPKNADCVQQYKKTRNKDQEPDDGRQDGGDQYGARRRVFGLLGQRSPLICGNVHRSFQRGVHELEADDQSEEHQAEHPLRHRDPENESRNDDAYSKAQVDLHVAFTLYSVPQALKRVSEAFIQRLFLHSSLLSAYFL